MHRTSRSTSRSVTKQAPAKINLSLEVIGRRPDGFHELVSVMQTVNLTDTLHLEPAPDVSLACSEPGLSYDGNLALRAVRLVRARFEIAEGAHLDLVKCIPSAAGLGGGSSDGAAALQAAASLWHLPTEPAALLSLAAELGSDVPFFLYGGTALVEGRGERVTPLPWPRRTWYLLVKPPISVSTATIFGALTRASWTDGTTTRQLARTIASRATVEIGINDLQATLFRLYPEARAAFEIVRSLAPGRTIISGSGPTVVALFESEDDARAAAAKIPVEYWRVVATNARPKEVD